VCLIGGYLKWEAVCKLHSYFLFGETSSQVQEAKSRGG